MNVFTTGTKCQNCKEFMDRLLKEQVEKLKQENRALKDRWQKFKEWAENNHNVADEDYSLIYCFVLNKMQELEKEIKC